MGKGCCCCSDSDGQGVEIVSVPTSPFMDQKPGTSGLRKKTKVFMQPHYIENFVQAVFSTIEQIEGDGLGDKTLVVGGDGRFFNSDAIQVIIKIAVAHGVGQVKVGKDGFLSTPGASIVIRNCKNPLGGFVLSASHNPGGKDEDFGIKFNQTNGGPAVQSFTDRIFSNTKAISSFRMAKVPNIDIGKIGTTQLGCCTISVVDPVDEYAALMEKLFDFEALRALFKRGFTMRFDAMNAISGPYAKRILETMLGAAAGSVINATPLPDFGGLHPDPNLEHAAKLVSVLFSDSAPDFGAASDGDADRNMILGRKIFVTPGDSVAIIAEYANSSIPAFREGLNGVARSMPTSMAIDRVAAALNVPCYETPTGWKFFGNLMDAGKCSICGEESFGTGSDHCREKDGLWAVLAWLSIIAKTGKSVEEIVTDHWKKFGRSYYQRHDFEGIDLAKAEQMMEDMRGKLASLVGKPFGGSIISKADDFSYTDSIDGSISSKQGLRVFLENGARIVARLSGTGTHGATLRLYLEQYRKSEIHENLDGTVEALRQDSVTLLELKERFGVEKATVVT